MSVKTKPHGFRYPWKLWFKKRRVTLVHGVHFCCRPDAFAQMALQRARKYHGFDRTIRVRISSDMRTVTIEQR